MPIRNLREQEFASKFIAQTNKGLEEGWALTSEQIRREREALTATMHALAPQDDGGTKHGGSVAERVSHAVIFMIVGLMVLTGLGAGGLPGCHAAADDPTATGDRMNVSLIPHVLHPVAEALQNGWEHVWKKYSLIVMLAVAVGLVKVFVLGHTTKEIVACAFQVTAFLLDHAVAIVRYVSLDLKIISRELRNSERQRR